MAKIFGQLERAQLENKASDPTAGVAGRLIFNTVSHLPKVDNGTSYFAFLLAGAGQIVNADVNSSAAIAGTKISPDFGSQNLLTTGEFRSVDGTAKYVGIKAPAAITASYTVSLPATAPGTGTYLGYDGSIYGWTIPPTSFSVTGTGTANQIVGVNAGASGNEWKTLAVGTSGTNFAIAHSANTVTFNIPDAGASNRGLVTTGAQTFAGVKTLSQPILNGVTTNSSAAAGQIGEVMTATNSAGVTLTSTVISNLTSITLTAGVWAVTGCVSFSGSTTSQVQGMISTSSTTQSGQLYDGSTTTISFGSASISSSSIPVGPQIWRVASSQVLNLNAQATSSGTPVAKGSITATRFM